VWQKDIIKSNGGIGSIGGNNDINPVPARSIQMGIKNGEPFASVLFPTVRLLLNIFRVGFIRNAYLDPNETKAIVGSRVYENWIRC
jgi:hypothetical protein